MTARVSLRSAIDTKCRECVHDPYVPGTWREQVAQCGGVNCPLYAVRPIPRVVQRNAVKSA